MTSRIMAPISSATNPSEPDPSPFLYPVALNLHGRRCIVVGGGSVGVRKAMALVAAGAEVTVIAPEASPALQALANEGCVTCCAEPFISAHLEKAFLVIAATNRSDVNQAVADAARVRGVLLNLAADADESSTGDFATMATARRGDLILGVTTGGAGPALAVRVRQEMEARYGLYWERYVALLGSMRSIAKREIADPEERAKALRRLAASKEVEACVANGNGDDEFYVEAMRCLFP